MVANLWVLVSCLNAELSHESNCRPPRLKLDGPPMPPPTLVHVAVGGSGISLPWDGSPFKVHHLGDLIAADNYQSYCLTLTLFFSTTTTTTTTTTTCGYVPFASSMRLFAKRLMLDSKRSSKHSNVITNMAVSKETMQLCYSNICLPGRHFQFHSIVL